MKVCDSPLLLPGEGEERLAFIERLLNDVYHVVAFTETSTDFLESFFIFLIDDKTDVH